MQKIQEFLNERANLEKAEFDSKIIKTKLPILGVKMGDLDKKARALAKEGAGLSCFDFLSYEEVVLAGMMIGYKKVGAKEKIEMLEKIFPYFDNWGVVDSVVPRLKGMEEGVKYFESLLESEGEFKRRVGIVYLMKFVLPHDTKRVVNLLKNAINDKYYVKMAIAWCYSEAFVRDFDFMKEFILTIDDKFVRNKSIQKACESFRLTGKNKDEIRLLKL